MRAEVGPKAAVANLAEGSGEAMTEELKCTKLVKRNDGAATLARHWNR